MTVYARIQDGVVAELFTPPAGVPITDCFHAGLEWIDCTTVAGIAAGWSWSGSAFAAPPAPAPPPLADQAAAALAAKVAAGIVLTCTSQTPFTTATYALDQTTMDQLGAVARDDAAGLGLPAGASTFTYPDLAGTPHALSGAQVQALYKEQRDLLFGLTTQAAIMKAGGTPTWPAQTATIA